MDPTIFVALTYMFIFGAMFGDAGQGACLVIGGFLLYKFKKLDLAAIIGTAGIFSTFFGLMFGSIFGFEDVIPAPLAASGGGDVQSAVPWYVKYGLCRCNRFRYVPDPDYNDLPYY